jgi:hypothetical protein
MLNAVNEKALAIYAKAVLELRAPLKRPRQSYFFFFLAAFLAFFFVAMGATSVSNLNA